MPRPAPKLQIWRFTWSHSIGAYWLALRACDSEDTGAAWLKIFQADEPGATFTLSAKRPAMLPDDRARHVAVYA